MDKVLVLGALAGGVYMYTMNKKQARDAEAYYQQRAALPCCVTDAMDSKAQTDIIEGDDKPRPSEYPYLDAATKFANAPYYENVAVERIYYEPNSLNGAVKEVVELYGTKYVSRGVNYDKYMVK